MTEQSNDRKRIKLDDLNRKVDFKVPDNYFDELPQIIQSRVADKKKPVLAWLFTTSVTRGAVSFATIGLLVASGIFFLRNDSPTPSTNCDQLACIDTQSLENYYEDEYMLDEDDVIESAVQHYENLDLTEFDNEIIEETKILGDKEIVIMLHAVQPVYFLMELMVDFCHKPKPGKAFVLFILFIPVLYHIVVWV